MRGTCAFAVALLISAVSAGAEERFAIRVVDDATGRGVPLVELCTVDQTRYVTDSAGLVAFGQPGLMNQKVFFHVESDGYEFPADGFGFRGKALLTTPGQTAELRITRKNIAERLYRVTGAGIYRDSVRLGQQTPLEQPLLNAQVTGSDSVNSIVYRDRIYWFWGDTNRAAYPLGNFHVPGATSLLPGQGGLAPSRGVNLAYFAGDDGFAKPTCKMPGDGPTWIDGLCKVRAAEGRERLFARYMKVRKFLEVYERGLVEFDPQKQQFEKVTTFDLNAPAMPHGHVLTQTVNGQDYLYFGNPYPHVRVRATAEALADLSQFEAFTCLAAGSTLAKPVIERDKSGAVVYGWKRNAPPLTLKDQSLWTRGGKLNSGESLLALRDVESGKTVNAHAGTVTFNAHRKRFVMITCESGGTSFLGELWYAESDAPVGPWAFARKVVTHKKYSFYNPRQHPMFDADGGRRIYFEGTYTTFMTGIERPTPLYDYNQIMYGLDLDDPRLVLPLPVYERGGDRQTLARNEPGERIAFFACDRPRAGLVAIGAADEAGESLSVITHEGPGKPTFYALPADVESPPSGTQSPETAPLFGWHNADGRVWYGVEGATAPAGYQREAKPLCRVWKNPLTFPLPR